MLTALSRSLFAPVAWPQSSLALAHQLARRTFPATADLPKSMLRL
ncbi:hypothetical protein [Polaromonas sp.]|nr:hypothetical protein [Polaromonas sp.]